MKFYFIHWQVKSKEKPNPNKVFTSAFSFPEPKAHNLVESGNKSFKRADHWLGDEDKDGEHLYKGFIETRRALL